MKKVTVITMMIAGIGLTAFKNSNKEILPELKSEVKMESPIGTQITYDVDVEKSSVGWHAKKVTGEHFGTIKITKGGIFRNKGLLTGGEFEMDMTSIADTDLTDPGYKTKLENHLKSEDFFDAAKFPKAVFKVKIWAPIKDAKPGAVNYYVKGDLTIKGTTKEISFPALVNIVANTITANADFNIDRTDFGLKYKSVKFDPGIGDKMINDEFNLKINLVAIYKK
ncbi:MAG TPA: YceI family protein [Bacteroidia bacterium]|nr:YceI family protein [Bacteroidia bacterium]